MALPTPDQLKSMDYTYLAQPFVWIPTSSSISLKSMDYVYQAQPFVSNPLLAGWSHKLLGVPAANISKIDGIPKDNVVKVIKT
jgi:hypothetical protein